MVDDRGGSLFVAYRVVIVACVVAVGVKLPVGAGSVAGYVVVGYAVVAVDDDVDDYENDDEDTDFAAESDAAVDYVGVADDDVVAFVVVAAVVLVVVVVANVVVVGVDDCSVDSDPAALAVYSSSGCLCVS